MSEQETLAEVVQGVMDARCPNHPADYGGCADCLPAAEEVTETVLAWLASVLADEATVKVVAREFWKPIYDSSKGYQREEMRRDTARALAALSAHLAPPAPTSDGAGETRAGR